MRIAICDDEKGICEYLESVLKNILENKRIFYEIHIYNSGEDFCHDIEKGKMDLIFLDIELPDFSGVKIGKYIREKLKDEEVQIAYISGKMEYAMELFEFRPINFLVKPLIKEKIEQVINKYILINSQEQFTFSYKKGSEYDKVEFSKILYFEKEGRKIHIKTKDKEDVFYGRMEDVYEKLKYNGFLYIHKSIIVNYNFIYKIKYSSIIMTDGKEFSISQSRRKEVRSAYIALRKREEKGV